MSLLHKIPQNRIKRYSQLKKMKWLKDIDWDLVKDKRLKAPIDINLYENNIHKEFLDMDVQEWNMKYNFNNTNRNQQGLLDNNEDLFKFFDYMNPASLHLFLENNGNTTQKRKARGISQKKPTTLNYEVVDKSSPLFNHIIIRESLKNP